MIILLLPSFDNYDQVAVSLATIGASTSATFVFGFCFLLLWIAVGAVARRRRRSRSLPLHPFQLFQEIDNNNNTAELRLDPLWIPVQLFRDNISETDVHYLSQQWPAPPHVWRSAAEPQQWKGSHRHLKQPYYPDCIWEVEPGPSCRVWKWPSSSSSLVHPPKPHHANKFCKSQNFYDFDSLLSTNNNNSKETGRRRMMIAHYKWDSMVGVPPRAALIMVHGLGSHTMYQFLRRAPDGEKLRRGLYYSGSFIERCTETLGMACYGMDLEGHGFSFEHSHCHPQQYNNNSNNHRTPSQHHHPAMFMPNGIQGAILDVQRLLEYVRKQHGWEDYSNIFLIGHGLGCLVITRAIQEWHKTQNTQKQNQVATVGGIISIAPLYGRANSNGSEPLATKLVSSSSSQNLVVTGFLYLALALLQLSVLVFKYYVLSSGYTTKKDDARTNASCHPTVIVKSISPGRLIEKWVSGDRDLDPLFHSPYTPIYAAQIQSTWMQFHALFQNNNNNNNNNNKAPQPPLATSVHTCCPLLVVHSPYDPVASYHAAKRFFLGWAASPENKEFYNPPETCHMLHDLMLETEGQDYVLKKIYTWLEARLPCQVV